MENDSQFEYPVGHEFAFYFRWVDYTDFPVGDYVTCNGNKARSWSCYYLCTPPSDTGRGGPNAWMVKVCFAEFHKSCALSVLLAPAQPPPRPLTVPLLCSRRRSGSTHSRRDPPSMDWALRLLATFLLFVVFPGAEAKQRVYYIGIVEDTWDYAPSGKNLLTGKDIADDKWVYGVSTRCVRLLL